MKKMNRIYLLTVLGMFLLTSLSVSAFDVPSNQPVTTETQGECDSLFITGGKGYAVKNVTMKGKNVSFVVCDSKGNKVRKVPWTQVQYLKKADGRIITADTIYENATTEARLEQKVENLLLVTIIAWLLGFGLFVAIPIWLKASKYRKKTHGHPKEKKLRKQLNWAVGLSIIPVLAFVILTILIISDPRFFFPQ